MYEGDDLNYDDEETPPEEASNRTFLIAAGILGGIVLLSIACLAVYALVIAPQRNAADQAGQNAQATQKAQVDEAPDGKHNQKEHPNRCDYMGDQHLT